MKAIIYCIIIFIFTNKLNAQDSSFQNNAIPQTGDSENISISFPAYFTLLGNDFKKDITAPFHLTHKQKLQAGIYVAGIITLQACSENFDEPIQKFAVKLHDNNNVVASISNSLTQLGGHYELYSLAAFGAYGFLFKNYKAQTTTLLATQAYITSGLIETGLKYLSGRQRPSYNNHDEAEPTYHGPGFVGNRHINSAFPSGHTTVIFAAATVFAKQYKNIGWVPPVAYSVASLVGLSRITQNEHWATDVIVGATLGYLCGNQVVNNYYRYIKAKGQNRKGSFSFNLTYNQRIVEPGFVYTFK